MHVIQTRGTESKIAASPIDTGPEISVILRSFIDFAVSIAPVPQGRR
jgi:hypothetical protein